MTEVVVIRAAHEGDLPALVELYNHYIRETPFTFDIDPYTVESRRPWFDQFADTGRHRLFVATDQDEQVRGFASSQRFRPKAAYDTSVETSIYLSPESTGRGIGSQLYRTLFEALRREDVHRLYAGVTLPNPASIAFHERFGYKRLGVYREVGRKFGCYWDVEWFEREFDGAGAG
ncbi:MAG: GNAT family N-acetyltransferase [Phycisphaerales bacterium]